MSGHLVSSDSRVVNLDSGAKTGSVDMPTDRRGLHWACALFFVLFVACYRSMLVFTFGILVNSDDMAHGFFAPIAAGYVAWTKKDKAFPSVLQPSWLGLPVLAVAGLIAVAGAVGISSTVSRVAFMLSLCGCALVLGGRRCLREFLFPIGLLLFTFPIPAVMYAELTQPLQSTATRLAEWAFEMIGYSVIRDGNVLELAHQRLSVIEACSGIRSLMTLSFFCIVYAYLLERSWWLRAFLVAASVPAAIGLNMVRIVLTGILGKHAPELTHGAYHDALAWALFAVAFGVVLLSHWTVRKFAGGTLGR